MSALDYLMKVKEYSLPEAVELIVGRDAIEELPTKEYEFKTKPVKKLLMPELADKPYRAKQYLRERGIYPEIIQYCIDNSLLFETAKYHNVVFVGYDKQGIAKYAAMRGTKSAYKGEVTGSDKRFSFSISETTNAEQHWNCRKDATGNKDLFTNLSIRFTTLIQMFCNLIKITTTVTKSTKDF